MPKLGKLQYFTTRKKINNQIAFSSQTSDVFLKVEVTLRKTDSYLQCSKIYYSHSIKLC